MQKVLEIIEEVKKAVVGKNAVVGKMLMVILAQGHILLEDIPGVGKTTLALAFSKAMALDYRRMQFTPDVMPTDVTGFSVYNKATGQLEYKPAQRCATSFWRTKSTGTVQQNAGALLEVMEEGRITVGRCDARNAQTVHCHRHTESGRLCRDPAVDGVPDGPLHGLPAHGIPQAGG